MPSRPCPSRRSAPPSAAFLWRVELGVVEQMSALAVGGEVFMRPSGQASWPGVLERRRGL